MAATPIGASSTLAAPPIRTSAANAVPACVTPDRLMSFLATRNPSVSSRYRSIAADYRRHGEAWRVRWDYAFFQMAIETNFLSFQRPDGRSGDVKPRQNNFAGLGTTGGGVPGDSYPDVTTGVLAQIQHLVTYSGERVAQPVGARTRLKQDDIISASSAITRRRAVTFQDLSGRWAADRKYGRSIDTIAGLYASRYCPGVDIASAIPAPPAKRVTAPNGGAKLVRMSGARREAAATSARTDRIAPPLPQRPQSASSSPTTAPAATSATPVCRVNVASFGGKRVVLIRSMASAGRVEFTALGVHSGFEESMTESFINRYAPGGQDIGRFDSREEALGYAYRLCPGRQSAAASDRVR